MREVCCGFVSTVMFRLLFVFFVFEFGVVGATLGAFAGAVIGWCDNMRLKESIIIGIASGTTLSYKLVKYVSDYMHSGGDDDDEDDDRDDDELVFLVRLVKLLAGDLARILGHDEHKIKGFNKGPLAKMFNLVDSYSS